MTAVFVPQISVTIPTTDGVPDYTMRCRLDGKDYNLRMLWNERSDRWHMSIYADDETPLVLGVKLVSNWPLLRYYHYDPNVPPGEMMVIDLSPDGSPPGLNELGPELRCQLVYFPTTNL